MADAIWDRRNHEHVKAMSALIAPLIAASRTRDFATTELTKNQMQAWIPTLKDVPADIIELAVDRLLSRGVTWMPKPGDVRVECAAIVNERRNRAATRAREMREDCGTCQGTTWEAVVIDGVERASRCRCFTRGLELINAAGPALALPPAREPDGEVA